MSTTGITEAIFRLDGKVAIVTGGAGGICSAICRGYANVGARVAVVDLDGARAEALAAGINAAGGIAMELGCDVTDEAATLAVVAAVRDRLGVPTVLLNGVAPLDRTATILDIGPEEWRRSLDIMLNGAYVMSRAVLPGMIAAGGGSIIHLASMHGTVARPGRVVYTTAKAGLVMLAKNMAIDHVDQKVRVNTLSPGAVATRRITYRYDDNPEEMRRVEQKYPMKRFAAPDEMVGAALFLASDASSYMTGSDLLVDGGYCAV